MTLRYKMLDDATVDRLDSFFNKKNTFIEVSPGNVLMPTIYQEIGDQILNFEVRKDDVWLISYPRTGSTWTQEMIWLLGNDLNYEGAKRIQQLRAPLLELTAYFQEDYNTWITSNMVNSVDFVKNLPSPRFIKSHLPWHLLPKGLSTVKPKIIYIARNTKDTCVSLYHHMSQIHTFVGTFEESCNLLMEDKIICGSIWRHMLAFWNQRCNNPNILFLKYEDMKKDLPSTIHKCEEFLGVGDKLNDEEMLRLCDHLNFDNMQRNQAVNLEQIYNHLGPRHSSKFIRKGQIGDWKNYMTKEMSQRFDEWIDINARGTGLEFDYE